MSLQSPFFWLIFSGFTSFYYLGLSNLREKRWIWILAASLIFVFCREPGSLVQLLAMSLLSYVAAIQIQGTEDARRRKFWLAATIVAGVSNLVFSKLHFGWATFGTSFFTFQMIGYLVDVERGTLQAERSFPQYLSSLACFIYIGAGPILRTADFLPQLKRPSTLTLEAGKDGLFLIIWGLSKKVIGDMLSLTVNAYFDSPGHGGALSAWTAVLALAGQYYADFSGYTDIAIGIGRILGLRLPENFRTPYLATSVADHWRRWHISLSEWFKEYVFNPLCFFRWPLISTGKSSQATLRIVISLLLTMSLIGLWHGLSWNNLLWGLYNGILIIAGFSLRRFSKDGLSVPRWVQILLTFYLLMLGRVFTRTDYLWQFWVTMKDMHTINPRAWLTFYKYWLLGLTLLGLVIPHAVDHVLIHRPEFFRKWRMTSAVALLLLLFILVFNIPGRPFLYEGY